MEYIPGQITAILNHGKKKTEGSDPHLAELFSKKKEKISKSKKKKAQTVVQTSQKSATKTQNKIEPNSVAPALLGVTDSRRKTEASILLADSKRRKKESRASGPHTTSNGFPFVHESLLPESTSTVQKPKKVTKKVKKKTNMVDEDDMSPFARRMRRRDKTADKRTIFVGNCPLSTDKKMMLKLFKDFGPIENVRFRCGPAATLELPRRAVIIKKDFHENASSYVCYIVFKEVESAEKALQRNGHVLDGLHLRVDLASNHKKHDKKRSVFVGNLPFSICEEDLRSYFEDCGAISNVRIVRDRQTSIGKGIAYVQFESKDSVTLAKKLNETELQGRKLRVMTCTNKPVKKVDNPRGKTRMLSGQGDPEKRRIGFAPSNRKSAKSFNEILEAKKEKRLKSAKKKKQGSHKSDGLSAIFGDMSADMKRLTTDNPRLRSKKPKDQKKSKKDKKKKEKAKIFKKTNQK